MSSSLARQKGYGVGAASLSMDPPSIIQNRAPRTSDYRFPLMQRWLNTNTLTTYELVSVEENIAIWNIRSAGNNLFPITPFVVGPLGQAGYQTIQSAINAAHEAGGGAVYIQQGNYTENLTLYDQVYLVAVPGISQGENQGVLIIGTHTPPTSGHVVFNDISLASTTDLFYSTAAGNAHIQVANCEFAVQNGYLFNLPNWTSTNISNGILEVYDCNPATSGAPWSINDGGINNTGGAQIVAYNTGIGNGTNVMTISGSAIFGQAVTVGCPLTCASGSNVLSIGSQYNSTVALNGNAILNSYSDSYVVGSSQAIIMDSSSNCSITNSVIQSSNNPAIGGTGAGILTIGGLTFLDNNSIANTLTLSYASSRLGSISTQGNLNFLASGNKINTPASSNTTSAGANAFGTVTLTSGTATVSTTAITSSSILLLSRQPIS